MRSDDGDEPRATAPIHCGEKTAQFRHRERPGAVIFGGLVDFIRLDHPHQTITFEVCAEARQVSGHRREARDE